MAKLKIIILVIKCPYCQFILCYQQTQCLAHYNISYLETVEPQDELVLQVCVLKENYEETGYTTVNRIKKEYHSRNR